MPQITLNADAILFDMDGTLVDSTAGLEGAWHLFRESYPTIDVHDILSSSHGVRTVDNLRNYCGIQDLEILQKEAERFEKAILTTSSEGGRPGIVLLPGVPAVMDELAPARFLPNPRWTICTSATLEYATAALSRANIPIPDVFVCSEHVSKGKPYPDPYLLGAEKAGVKPENCIVFEDAPNGVRSGVAAGCTVIALLTTHSREQLEAATPHYIIKDLSSVSVRRTENSVVLTLKEE
ncbi:HAD-like domain-containing protein [Panaeolus papilionaceus]|nr:HAD-like domain-containing protein [Panaeolus papilionaceus]